MSLYQMLETSYRTSPEKIAIIDDRGSLTYQQLYRAVDGLAAIFRNLGVTRSSIVALCYHNSADFIIAMLAVNKLGGIFSPLSAKLTAQGFSSYVAFLEPVVVATEPGCELLKLEHSPGLILTSRIKETMLQVDVYQDQQVVDQSQFDLSWMAEEQVEFGGEKDLVAEILFTSGSTGDPKGIMLTNENIAVNVEDIVKYLDLGPEDVSLLVKPMVHSSTINGEIITTIRAGGTIVTTQRLVTPGLVLDYIERYRVTALFLIPTLLNNLITYNHFNVDKLTSLRFIHFYGSPISPHILQKAVKMLPQIDLIYSYGLTEASPRVTYIKKKDWLEHIGSSGQPLASVSIKLMNEQEEEIREPGVHGEIYVQGPNVMKGYFKNPELTAKVLRPSGLKTGDQGYWDADGFLYVVGRVDEMIIKGGVNLFPAEIENVLYLCSKVKSALVRGIPDPVVGEKIECLIVAKEGVVLTEQEVIRHCQLYLESSKIPDVIRFFDELDTTLNGKIKRK